jgi:hypothetical protein
MSKNSETQKRWRRNFKEKLVLGLGGKCRICGYNRTHKALHIHHVDPSKKEFQFSKIMAHPIAWEKAVKEAKKCILLCGNCHAEVHDGLVDISEYELIFKEIIPG